MSAILIAVLINFLVGAWLWTYTINAWLVFFNHLPVLVWWHGGLLGMVRPFSKIILPVVLVTWMAMMIGAGG